MEKWNPFLREYFPYDIPRDWNCSAYEDNMDKIVSCAGCGRKLPYGICFTSLEIHTPGGFGYAVCDKCYTEEVARRLQAENERR